MSRDIDLIIERVKSLVPDVQIGQLRVSHSGFDDDGLWFFQLLGTTKDIQLESSHGTCPFIVEHSDMKSSTEAEIARSVDDAVAKVVAYLASLKAADRSD